MDFQYTTSALTVPSASLINLGYVEHVRDWGDSQCTGYLVTWLLSGFHIMHSRGATRARGRS